MELVIKGIILLILMGSLQGIFLSFILASKNKFKKKSNLYLAVFILAFSLCRIVADLPAIYTSIANDQIDAGENVDYWKSTLELVAATDTTDCEDARLNNEASTATDMLKKSGVVNASASSGSDGLIVNNFF